MKNGIFVGKKHNTDDILKVTNDIASLINKTNNISSIVPNNDGAICLFGDNEVLLQIGEGKSTNGNYYDVLFFYGKEEDTIQSFNFDNYEDFIQQVVKQVNEVFNRKIKIVTYSEKRKFQGKKFYFQNSDNEWELYDSFELNSWFFRIFISKSYFNEDIYDFTL